MSGSAVKRAPPRPGGAALQMDVLELGSFLEAAALAPGRLKEALEDMCSRALRPEKEAGGAAAGSLPADEPRVREYARFRTALAAGGGSAGSAAAALIPDSVSETSTSGSAAADGAQW